MKFVTKYTRVDKMRVQLITFRHTMMPAVMQALKSSCENYVPFNICASQNILLLSQKVNQTLM